MSLTDWCMLALMLHGLRTELSVSTTPEGLIRRQHLIGNISSNTVNDTKLQKFDRCLSLPTRYITHLKLMLRRDHLHQDAENAYTRWFMERSPCQLTIASYYESNQTEFLHHIAGVSNRFSYVIVTDMSHLSATSERFLQRAGSFFFILTDNVELEPLRDILQLMWNRFKVFKNFILTPVDGVLIFDPFEYDAQCLRYGMLRNYSGNERLERILFRDMRGYPLRIQIFKSVYARPQFDERTGKISDVYGVDGEVARLLEERMNFSMILQDPDPDYFGERDANGTYRGAIGSVINNEIDMCLTGFFVKDYKVPEMAFTVAVYDDQLCIYVPKASRVPQSILPIFAISYSIWITFISSVFVCALIWWIIRCINLWLEIIAFGKTARLIQKNHWRQFTRIYIDTWVVWVRVNVVNYPPFHSERVFLASLSLVSVIFGAIFESSLATVYIRPLYYNDINTLRELDESGLKIIYKFSSMADDLFFSETSAVFANLNKKLKHEKDLNADVILDIARNGGKAGVSRWTSLSLESFHFIVSKRIWIVPECPKYYAISYVMPKDSPWERGVNNLLLRFLNAGLIVKWIKDMEAQVDRKIMKEQIIEPDDYFKVLTVADLQLAFYVVFLGSFFAIASFIGEMVLKRSNKRIKRWE